MIASPLRPRQRQESGIAAASRLAHRGTPYGASLSFTTTAHLWPLSDPPSRRSRSANSHTGTARSIPGRALASSMLDSPYQGSRTGLTPPISTPVPSTPAPPRPTASAPQPRSLPTTTPLPVRTFNHPRWCTDPLRSPSKGGATAIHSGLPQIDQPGSQPRRGAGGCVLCGEGYPVHCSMVVK